jgi:alpha-beta hydrolase superfamily lysophospholipase
MQRQEGTFAGQAGIEIHWQAWLPEQAPRATVAIAHGVSEHSDRYAHVAERLVASGYAAYALDHRGHGRSGGPRAVVDRLEHAVEDLRRLIAPARAAHPGVKLFLLGHSMGGTIALEHAIDHQDELDGLILSAPAADQEAASRLELWAARALAAVAPRLGVFRFDKSDISRDPEVVRGYEQDPMIHQGGLPARTVHELSSAIATFSERTPTLTLPLLVMVGTGDRIVPPAASRMVHKRASSADKTLREYEGLYHEILNEPERAEVMDDLVGWLDAHVGA